MWWITTHAAAAAAETKKIVIPGGVCLSTTCSLSMLLDCLWERRWLVVINLQYQHQHQPRGTKSTLRRQSNAGKKHHLPETVAARMYLVHVHPLGISSEI